MCVMIDLLVSLALEKNNILTEYQGLLYRSFSFVDFSFAEFIYMYLEWCIYKESYDGIISSC